MSQGKLTKENVLAQVDSYELLNYYLKPFHNYGNLKEGQHISNPFISEKQKTPSFNIYHSALGLWRYKDFATRDDGDVFELIMRLRSCEFYEALETINQDHHLNLGSSNTCEDFTLDLAIWTEQSLHYWKQFGIDQNVLNRFKVKPIKSYIRTLKNGELMTVESSSSDPIYAYEIEKDCYKVYRPLNAKYKFSWLGNKPSEYVYGLDRLPLKGEEVYLTGGEKDVLSLSSIGKFAICLNSETALPSKKLIEVLKSRFNKIVVLYDLDETGLKQSEKLCKSFGLTQLILPDVLKEKGGKDISDYFRFGLQWDESLFQYNTFENQDAIDPEEQEILDRLLSIELKLKNRKSEEIKKVKAILNHQDNGLIFPRTINIIQGKAGVHKSRLAETICSALIKKVNSNLDLLGFSTDMMNKPTIAYIDTERNLSEQFPYALQQVLSKAGYSKDEDPFNFKYTSLLHTPRAERFKELTIYLNWVRTQYQGNIVIVLDVVTDCIRDFNKAEDSMGLIDLMNSAINKYDVTFICLIHENPGNTDKARGHLGTELMNKSSTVMQVGFEKGKNGKASDLIALNFLKTRSTKRFESMYLRYCELSHGLVQAEPDAINEVMQSRQMKAEVPEIIEYLQHYIKEPVSSKTLLNDIADEFQCSTKIARTRLKEICEQYIHLKNHLNELCHLEKAQIGKEVFYQFKVLEKQKDSMMN